MKISYDSLKLLCQRRNAWIIRGYNDSGEKVVIKIFRPEKLANGSYQNELRILEHLANYPSVDFVQKLLSKEYWSVDQVNRILHSTTNYPGGIIRVTSDQDRNGFPVLITGYCGRDLFSSLTRSDEKGKRFTVNPVTIDRISRAVDIFAREKLPILHRIAGVIHCDIKVDNITYNPKEDRCYLIDFGSAILDGESSENPWNERTSPYYSLYFDTEIERDEYAMGLVIYYIAHKGHLPDENDTDPWLTWNDKRCTTQNGYGYCSCTLNLLD